MASQAFSQAREFLLKHREYYNTAYRDFRWPKLHEFNWALDWSDDYALGNDDTALWIVEEGGNELKRSFAQMSVRSNQVENYLRGLGVRRGDRILLMLANQVALWETLLAAMKLGAVTIPATLLLTPADITDRIQRGDVKHVVTNADQADKFSGVDGGINRIAVDSDSPLPFGWTRFEDASKASPVFEADARTLATDPLLLYFTSGTTRAMERGSHDIRTQ